MPIAAPAASAKPSATTAIGASNASTIQPDSGSAQPVAARSTTRTRAGTFGAPACSSATVQDSVTTLPSVIPDCITRIAAPSSASASGRLVG